MCHAIRYTVLCLLLGVSFVGEAVADGFFAVEGSSLALAGGTREEVDLHGLRLRLGTPVSESLDIEGHFGFSFDQNTDQFQELGALYYGVYLKGYLPVGYHSALFAVAGMTTVDISQKVRGAALSDTRAGFSYGFGLETQLTESADLTADFMSYVRDQGLFEEVSSLSFGIKVYF